MDQLWEDKIGNLQCCRLQIEKAKKQSVDLVVFPEMTLTGFSMNVSVTAEDSKSSVSLDAFKKLALDYDMAIMFGVVLSRDTKFFNAALLIDRNGCLIGEYEKMHPFSFSGENAIFSQGNQLCVAQCGSVNIGMTICYDLRFPELYSALGARSQLIINIANWPMKRISHWDTLLKARAIENQLFVVGVNRVGVDGNNLAYAKSSRVVNANGEFLDPIASDSELDVFEVDFESLDKYRLSFSTVQDRRPELYKYFL